MLEVIATVVIAGLIGALAYVRLQKVDRFRTEQETRFAQRSTRNTHNNGFQQQQHQQFAQQIIDDTDASSNMWFE